MLSTGTKNNISRLQKMCCACALNRRKSYKRALCYTVILIECSGPTRVRVETIKSKATCHT